MSLLLISRASSTLPASKRDVIWLIAFGKTLAVTEITPCPLACMKSNAVKSSPLVSVTVSPLIVSGFVDDITGEETVPVTVKSSIVFVVPSITTVLFVVSAELLVAVVFF